MSFVLGRRSRSQNALRFLVRVSGLFPDSSYTYGAIRTKQTGNRQSLITWNVIVADMAMNYVTFNQDYSHLAVGRSNSAGNRALPDQNRNIARLSYLHHRPLLKMLRDKGRQHCNTRDALLNLLGLPYSLASPAANHEYKG